LRASGHQLREDLAADSAGSPNNENMIHAGQRIRRQEAETTSP
jgi:hypothetical protein